MTAGGWTVLFRRDKIPDTIEFQHPIKTYKYGFGDLNTNHFLGIHQSRNSAGFQVLRNSNLKRLISYLL